MRPAALLTSICALSTSAYALDLGSLSSMDIGDLTSGAESLISHYKTESPTQLLSQATAALGTLSELAATATGPVASSLRAEYTSLKSQLAGAQSTVNSIMGETGTASGSAPSASASGSSVPSTGLAPETVVPMAAIGVGMVVIGFL